MPPHPPASGRGREQCHRRTVRRFAVQILLSWGSATSAVGRAPRRHQQLQQGATDSSQTVDRDSHAHALLLRNTRAIQNERHVARSNTASRRSKPLSRTFRAARKI